MRGVSGLLLIGIGLLHTVVGVFNGYRILTQISQASFSTEKSRQLVSALGKQFVFWFLLGGALMIVLGHLFAWIERSLKRHVPSFMGWELVVLSVTGLLFMPLSGFWLVLALAIYVIVMARRSRQGTSTVM